MQPARPLRKPLWRKELSFRPLGLPLRNLLVGRRSRRFASEDRSFKAPSFASVSHWSPLALVALYDPRDALSRDKQFLRYRDGVELLFLRRLFPWSFDGFSDSRSGHFFRLLPLPPLLLRPCLLRHGAALPRRPGVRGLGEELLVRKPLDCLDGQHGFRCMPDFVRLR